MPKIQVTPTVIFQTPKKFEQSVKGFKEVCEYPHYRVSDGVVSKQGKVTYGGYTCGEIALTNGNDTAIFHLAPEFRSANTKEKLDEAIRKFKDKGNEFHAFITGGFSRFTPPNKQQALESFDQLVDIGNIVAKHTDNITMVAGKYKNGFMDNLAVKGNEIFVSNTPKLGANKYMPNYQSTKDTGEALDILSKEYEIVDADGPRIIIDM